jgi:hypothetical protein
MRDQIPGRSLRDEAERIDGALGALAVRAAVLKGELAIAGDGVLHDRQ